MLHQLGNQGFYCATDVSIKQISSLDFSSFDDWTMFVSIGKAKIIFGKEKATLQLLKPLQIGKNDP